MRFRSLLLSGSLFLTARAQSQVRILFDATRAETAGNADWVIDADARNLDWNPTASTGTTGFYTASNPQRVPTPAQAGVTATTPETFWDGALSAWAVDCAKRGYVVESLPYNGSITYGNASNPQDLSNYKVFVIDEPNIKFTAAEKTAILQWVKAGGGLFMVSDHDQSDRNNDGWDSPAIWNDLLTNNTVAVNPFGISFDLANFSETSSNVIAAANDSLIHGPMGNVTQVKWSAGTSMTLSASANATVKGVVYRSGSSGSTGVLAAYARWGAGKVAAIGDSSPTDDGTGNPACTLYNGYFTDAAGNHQRLLMNATIWLATGSIATALPLIPEESGLRISGAAGTVTLWASRALPARTLALYDVAGHQVWQGRKALSTGANRITAGLAPGVYWLVTGGQTLPVRL